MYFSLGKLQNSLVLNLMNGKKIAAELGKPIKTSGLRQTQTSYTLEIREEPFIGSKYP